MSHGRLDHLHAAAQAAVQRPGAEDAVIGPLEPFEYTKSAPLYRTTLAVAGHEAVVLVKDLSRSSLLPGARKVKPGFLHDPWREIAMYRDVLPGMNGVATYHGHHLDDATGAIVLVIEYVSGLELCDVGSVDIWAETARRLGAFHSATSTADASTVPLCIHDGDHYRTWRDRALAMSRNLGCIERAVVRHLIDVYERDAIGRLLCAPSALIHGELYPSNVIVGGARLDGTMEAGGPRICPVDWESAAAGPALLDLAALTTGDWSDTDRARIVDAYRDAAGGGGAAWDDRDLAACSLQLAIQWLGWFGDHDPPPWQQRNWIEEAEAAVERLA